MSIASEIERITSESERIDNNVQTALNTIAATGVEVGSNSDALPAAAADLVRIKQNKLFGAQGQFVGFDENGEAIAQNLPEKQNPIKGNEGQMVGFDSEGNAVAQDFPDKQDPITGSAGQFVGFNEEGKPEAQDFPEPEPNTWDNTQGKPFCNEIATGTAVADGETLSWDGNKDAMPIVTGNAYTKWCYVSDNVPTMEQISAGHALVLMTPAGTEINIPITPTETDNYIYFGDLDGEYAYIAKRPFTSGSNVFERAGVYFFAQGNTTAHICRLTINGYTFTPCTAYAPIGEEYIPSSIQRVGNPLYLYATNGTRYELIVGTDGALSTKRA